MEQTTVFDFFYNQTKCDIQQDSIHTIAENLSNDTGIDFVKSKFLDRDSYRYYFNKKMYIEIYKGKYANDVYEGKYYISTSITAPTWGSSMPDDKYDNVLKNLRNLMSVGKRYLLQDKKMESTVLLTH